MWAKLWLAMRSVAMVVLFPGTVAGYIPYRYFFPEEIPAPTEWVWYQYLALAVIGVGLAILLRCVWEFAHHGRGTLAPFDEPRKLVVQGLYRYVRNPMYVGVVTILLGEAWFFSSKSLLVYAVFFFVGASVFVMGFEEPRLRAKFGDEYENYRNEVGRWIPGQRYQKDL